MRFTNYLLAVTAALSFSVGIAGAQGSGSAAANPAAKALDFEFFKSRIEPIFLKRRAGHARCYVCHAGSTNQLSLEKLAPGATMWTEEQSRKNFEKVSRLVTPGDPAASRFAMHPLAPEAGGDPTPGGGRQFENKDDPDWQAIAQWVRGAKYH
jgi:hypothetical protein